MNPAFVAELNGVELKKSEINLLTKLEEKYGASLDVFAQGPVTLVNRFTGVKVQTTRLVAMLYKFTIEAISSYEMSPDGKMFFRGKPVAIDTYDRVRYLILKLDKTAYYDLVD